MDSVRLSDLMWTSHFFFLENDGVVGGMSSWQAQKTQVLPGKKNNMR